MGKKVDLTGQRFGMWTVLSEAGRDNHRKVLWNCRCDCGEERKVGGCSLRAGNTTSCGCMGIKDITGKRFGSWTVLEDSGERTECRTRIWNCVCECGEYRGVNGSSLISGRSVSCGCLKVDKSGEKNPKYNPNLTEEDRLRRCYYIGGGNQRSWSKQIMERDNYTCQICGDNKGGNLNAHHLNAWNAFPEQRFDLDNGVTLCTDCHKEFHSQYGYGDNTREQFNEYAASKTLVLN